ncbi:MAG: hypothetical protein LBG19_09830 [Prevotellaceae bacterium]|jgi:beta-lactamase regulating signal transducer with metallopeptidase domain|nr:hypothetical protein [Prevotellaceae bacterium]
MENITHFLLYFLEINAPLAVLGGFYLLALRKNTYCTLNRTYILLAFAIAFIIPLVESPISISGFISSPDTETPAIAIVPTLLLMESIEHTSDAIWTSWEFWVSMVFIVGFTVQRLRLLAQLISLYFFARKSLVRKTEDSKFYVSNQEISPFSFFGFIYINPSLYTEQELTEILTREQTHVKQSHSIDILLLEPFRCFFWMNPFAYILRKEARQNLEYIADRRVA